MTVVLANARNFRHACEFAQPSTPHLRRGTLYRSGDLSALDDSDLQQLASAGISLIIDLRSAYECQRRPNRLPAGGSYQLIHGNIHVDVRAANGSLGQLLRSEAGPAGVNRMMHATYAALPAAMTPLLAPVVQAIIDTPGATLVMCTAGKDRTGYLIATLLTMIGIDRDTVIEDYLMTNQRIDLDAMAATSGKLMQELFDVSLPREALDVVNQVSVHYLETAAAAVRTQYGDVERWLAAAGIDTSLRSQLRSRLLA